VISYGVYLFHWPIFLWLSPERTGLPAVPLLALRLTVTLTLAILSFRFLERPILTGARLRRPPTREDRVRKCTPSVEQLQTTGFTAGLRRVSGYRGEDEKDFLILRRA